MKKKRVTLQDVAREAGVSKPVASVALSGTKKGTTAVSEETKKRVAEVAARLGYKPNFIARSLTHQRSFTIGLLMNQVNGDLAQDVLAASQEVLTGARLCSCGSDSQLL